MHEDDLILLGGFLLLGAAVFVLAVRSKDRRTTIFRHLVILALYSAPLLYGLFALSKEGDALVWWFYLLLALGAHFLVTMVLLVRSLGIRPRGT